MTSNSTIVRVSGNIIDVNLFKIGYSLSSKSSLISCWNNLMTLKIELKHKAKNETLFHGQFRDFFH
jgi:hypothetical protein